MALKNPGVLGMVLLCSSLAHAQQRPDFSGTWRRDFSQSPSSAFGPPDWTIKQTYPELILETGGQTFVFVLDGTEHVYIDDSLGDLPNFVRKIRTKAFWDGSMLHTERTSFAEQRDPETGKTNTPAGAITIVEKIEISADGRTLVVHHDGYRAVPPDLLHGKPYARDSDPAAKSYRDIFRRVSH